MSEVNRNECRVSVRGMADYFFCKGMKAAEVSEKSGVPEKDVQDMMDRMWCTLGTMKSIKVAYGLDGRQISNFNDIMFPAYEEDL